MLHRRLAHNNTFVVQGEHRLYHPSGEIKEIRAVGSMTSSTPNPDPHREGGGPDPDVIIAFSIRGTGVLFELLDDHNVIGSFSCQDLKDLHAATREAVAA